MKAYNIMEDIVRRYLDDILKKQPHLCSCTDCREDISAYVLSRIPPRYVTTDSGAMYMLRDQLRVEHASLIIRELLIAIELIKNKQHRHDTEQDRDVAYRMLLEHIKLERGVDFLHYRDNLLKRRIGQRMNARNASNFAEYLQVLTHDQDEYERLFEVLTINVTSFFRDKNVWDSLQEKFLPGFIREQKAKGRKKIRVWSAGCSSGEEAYSLAILFYLLCQKENLQVEITAVDIDKECLKQARQGVYRADTLKNIDQELLRRFFLPLNGDYRIVPFIQQMVNFREQNIIDDQGVYGQDMIICRNVFIYFNRSLQEHLITKFYNQLTESGLFLMGASENLMGDARVLFSEVSSDIRLYRKNDGDIKGAL